MANDIKVNVAFANADKIAAQFGGVNLGKGLQDEINKILLIIESYGKQLAPVDTGLMRSKIHTSPAVGSALSGMVSTDTDYSIYVHEGTRKMRARPFLETGANMVNGRLEGQISARLDEDLRKAFVAL